MKKIIFIGLILIAILFYNLDFKDKISQNNNLDEVTSFNERLNYDTEVNIYNFEKIKIDNSKEEVISLIGEPKRIDKSEYDFDWYVYNQYEENFVMVGIKNDRVVGLYSNSINNCEIENISINDSKDLIMTQYEILEYKKKGNTRYMINSNNQYDIVKKDGKYITFFYDIYEDYRICSYQIISEESEIKLDGIYPLESDELANSFELQVIDLTNSERYQRNLNGLKYSENATISSRKHSKDMGDNNFFEHTNKKNESPFDRMKKENIIYIGAGENIAAGQTSAIYAHEAWMNSEGHRKNILGDYNNIGVGVVFGGYYKIYYTQNFYR
ncbi:MAG: CAP-associated domain-containing protein [Romboutsia sp.]|uniref:CAP domain-containing protein n=1 Tax=Romboutsia sp. TaxID=1965302 RepID=UPI003F2C559F